MKWGKVADMNQYQHLTQRAYLNRWNTGAGIHQYDKQDKIWSRAQAAKRLGGEYDIQPEAMEKRFVSIEKHVGHTNQERELHELAEKEILAGWIALHAVRCRRNIDLLKEVDYSAEVKQLTDHLLQFYANWCDFKSQRLITSDNPVLFMKTVTEETFYIVPVSPLRCAFLCAVDKYPETYAMHPHLINRLIYNGASRYCYSFDRDLHRDP